MIEIVNISPRLALLNLELPGAGYREFVTSYIFKGERYAMIDCGPKSMLPELLVSLEKVQADPKNFEFVILSHIHLDHAGGVGTLLKEMPNARVVAHSRARQHLIDPALLWEASLKTLGDIPLLYGQLEPVPADKIVDATDGMQLDLGGGLVLEVLLTPGHASHHLSLYDRADRLLVAGEAAGINMDAEFIRPNTPPPFRFEDGLASLDRMLALNPEKVCFAHFGCHDNALKKLWAAREQLVTWYNLVQEASKAGKTPAEIIPLLKSSDKNLAYLDRVKDDKLEREIGQLTNTIIGLAGSAKKR